MLRRCWEAVVSCTYVFRHRATTKFSAEIRYISSDREDHYRDKVVSTYDDPPEMWHKALGDNLSFQFGLFDQDELNLGPRPGPVGPSEFRHFDRQLELAGLLQKDRPQIKRILDLGCGWGYISKRMATLFPDCERIDAINISERQLRYCAENLSEDLAKRILLYHCNGQDVDLLPQPDMPYDLVIVRGVYTHFSNSVFEESVTHVAARLRPGGLLIISDTLYTSDLKTYKSAIPDASDRLACGNRKTPEYFSGVLKNNGLEIQDMRIMPSNREVIHWFQKVRLNIDKSFPHGAVGPIQELHEMADSFSTSLAKNKASVYSSARRAFYTVRSSSIKPLLIG
ncbi:hypothetical protein HIM_10546 [Hirsutella minnesotensis 3608]|uniref:Methyltransferase domain-containing protein n=1 Tax=Hirsutella minnesotensis 3608 TaxID=1043627 RepID=A0A0F7ZRR3_9HYPO|nr:hypothetical protein HIM_10546 [Hirsutella minnesotensis 3608]